MDGRSLGAGGGNGAGSVRSGAPRGLASALVVMLLAAPAGPGLGEPVRVSRGDLGQGVLPVPPQSARGPGHHGPLVEIELPPLESDSLALSGTVAYRQVDPPGYLEMWVVFADGSRYFTRSLAPRGPLAGLAGTSEARPFVLPFRLDPRAGQSPVRVELGVVLPGGGEVELRELRFESPAPSALSFADPGGWWSARTSDRLGAVFGSSLGLLGAILGMLASRRGLSAGALRRVALVLLAGGGPLAALGAVAAAVGQPRHVWLALLVLGGVTVCVGLVVLNVAPRIADRPRGGSRPAAPHVGTS